MNHIWKHSNHSYFLPFKICQFFSQNDHYCDQLFVTLFQFFIQVFDNFGPDRFADNVESWKLSQCKLAFAEDIHFSLLVIIYISEVFCESCTQTLWHWGEPQTQLIKLFGWTIDTILFVWKLCLKTVTAIQWESFDFCTFGCLNFQILFDKICSFFTFTLFLWVVDNFATLN